MNDPKISPDQRRRLVEELIEFFSMDRMEAEELVAIELGESDGDFIAQVATPRARAPKRRAPED